MKISDPQTAAHTFVERLHFADGKRYIDFFCPACRQTDELPWPQGKASLDDYSMAHRQRCRPLLFGSSRLDQAIAAARSFHPPFDPRYLISDRIEMSNLEFVTLVEKLVEALAVGSAVDRRNELESLVALYRRQLEKCVVQIGRAPASLPGNNRLFMETNELLDRTAKKKERPKSEYVAATLNDAISLTDFKAMITYIETIVGRSFHYYANTSNTTIELNEATLLALVNHAKKQADDLERLRVDLKQVHRLVEHSLGPILEAL